MSPFKASLFLLTGILLMVGGASLFVTLSERRVSAVEEQLAAGREALMAGDPDAAAAAFTAALERDPEQAEAAAALFDIVVYFDRAEARRLLSALRAMDAGLEAVLARQVRLSVLEGDLEAARQAAASLEAVANPGLETQLARLDLLVAGQDFEAALPLLARLRETWPANRRIRLFESQVLANGDSVLQHIRAKQGFLSLLDYPDEEAFKAAVILTLDQSLPLFPTDRVRAAEALEKHPRLTEGLEQLDPPILRSLAVRLAELRPELAFTITDFLVSQPDPTREDSLIRLYAGQNSGNWAAVSDTSRDLTASAGAEETPEALLLARQHIAEDAPEAALTLVEGYMAGHPGDPGTLEVLITLAEAHLETLPEDARVRLAEAFRRHPAGIPVQYLQATRLLMELQPDKREALLTEAVARLAADFRPALANWLISHGETARVLKLIPEAEALADRQLSAIRLDALARDSRYTDMLAYVGQTGELLAPWEQDLERARVHLLMGDPVACRELLHTIPHRLPVESRNALFSIGKMADSIGDADLARRVFGQAFADGLIFPFPHSMMYLKELLDAGDFEQALDFTAYCRNIRPENPYYINNHTYLKLIGGRLSPTCIADMQAIVEAHPEVVEFHLSYALALMMSGYPGRAMEALGPIGSDDIPYEPRSRMAYALVLAGTGAQDKAAPLIRSIDLASLMEPEQVLVDRYLRDGKF
jgi:tetratricopeptide (TPR) repeat protein